MERVAHAEDKRDAALSRCATLEDDVAALRRNLEDTTVALKHQTQCAQTFALGLTKHSHDLRLGETALSHSNPLSSRYEKILLMQPLNHGEDYPGSAATRSRA